MSKKKKEKKVTTPKVGKYVFETELMGRALIEDGSSKNLYAIIGKRTEGFLVDVLWYEPKESDKWEEYKIDLETEGCHSFKNYSYLKNKI